MRKKTLGLVIAGAAVCFFLASLTDSPNAAAPGGFNQAKQPESKALLHKAVKLQIPFIENQGQLADEKVRFYAKTFGGTAHVTNTGEMIYQFSAAPPATAPDDYALRHKSQKPFTISESLVDSFISPPKGVKPAQTRVNYLLGRDPKEWRTNLPAYDLISLGFVYEGIELFLKAYDNTLEKIFTVRPGGDPSSIRIALKGAKSLRINDQGQLEIETDNGTLRFSKPIAYQELEGRRNPIDVAYALSEEVYIFRVGSFDPSRPLFIDPILEYNTLLGGSGEGFRSLGYGVAVDGAGSAYVTGRTSSSDFPTTQDAIQRFYGGGLYDAFVSKLNADGSQLVYSTYLGGSGEEWGSGIAVDDAGNVYVTGRTSSSDFPTTQDAIQRFYGGGLFDAFVTKLNADGSDLVYSTYLGGSDDDYAYAIALDGAGNAYVTGHTDSSDFPTTIGAFQEEPRGGFDTFVSKLNADGSDLVYSTYLGGSGDDYGGIGIALDGGGNAYITGETGSSDFPTTIGAFQEEPQGGFDAFVSKLNADGSDLIYSTYFGGSADDAGYGIALDSAGHVYVAGITASSPSSGFPVTQNAFQENYGGGLYDAFVSKLDADGSDLVYSTYLGGSGDEYAYDIAVDNAGNVYVTGQTSSSNFPTQDPIQESSGGGFDAFVSKLNPAGAALVYSTYLGGSDDDYAWGIAVDSAGNAYVTGGYGGLQYDVFVAKISEDSDGDGLPDWWEELYFGCTTCANPGDDPDEDGLTNLQEYEYGTDPTNWDTDGDGLKDGDEVEVYQTDPNDGRDLFLLTNPGFEEDLSGWTTDHGYIRNTNPPPYSGTKYLMGGIDVASSYTYQTVDLLSSGMDAEAIDQGRFHVYYGGWQAGYQEQQDQGKIEIILRDEGGSELSRHDLGWFYSNSTWVLKQGMETLLPGTRFIVYGFYSERDYGANNDGYLDDAFLIIGHRNDSPGPYPTGITGTVYELSTGEPLQGIKVLAIGVSSDQIEGSALTNASGSYMIDPLASGTYRVVALGGEGGNFFSNQFYNESGNWEDAAIVSVLAGTETPEIDFLLAQGGKISGRVTRILDGQGLAFVEMHALEFGTGKFVGFGDTDGNGQYTIGGLAAGDYLVLVRAKDSPYWWEYYDNVYDYDKGAATGVAVSAGLTTSGIDFELESRFTISAAIGHRRNPDETGEKLDTVIEVIPGNDFPGFPGSLPGAVLSITVTGPKDFFASYPGDGWEYNSQFRSFSKTIEGSPELGLYTFTVRSASAAGVAFDHQYAVRELPLLDESRILPADSAVLTSKTPSFTWSKVEYADDPDIALYYRLDIWEVGGERVFATNWVHDMDFYTLPPAVADLFDLGKTYQWRVRATDGPDWIKAQNGVYSEWRIFTVAENLRHSSPPAIPQNNFVATTWSSPDGTAFIVSIPVVDLDGVCSENLTGNYGPGGVSHTGTVIFPDGVTTTPLIYEGRISATSASFYAYVSGVPPPGLYTVTVTDPDGNTGIITDELTVNPLDPPVASSILPNSRSEQITARYDNVYVNESLYDDFDAYSSIGGINSSKWGGYMGDVGIIGGALVTTISEAQARGEASLSFRNPQEINSIQADITIESVSGASPRARIVGYWFNNGRGDVHGNIQVRGDRVLFSVTEEFINNQNTWEWKTLAGDDLLSVQAGDTITASVHWDGASLCFSATNTRNSQSAGDCYTPAGPTYPPTNPWKSLQTRIHLTTSTTPTFSWGPVPDANWYRVRIYNSDNSRTIRRGDTEGAETSYTVPPGILKPNSFYRFRMEARDAKNPLDIDNASRVPGSANEHFIFYTDGEEATKPFIDPSSHGVRTWSSSEGIVLSVWAIVHDAQGVPGNIKTVMLRHPDDFEEELLYWVDDFYGVQTRTSGAYILNSERAPVDGIYTITVEDLDGNIGEWSEELVVNPIGYPSDESLSPANGTVLGSTGGTFSWDAVDGAATYRLQIFDYDFNRIYSFYTTTNEFALAPGLLEEGTTYRYQVQVRRELHSDNVDNQSVAPAIFQNAIVFSTTAATDTDDDGLPDWWEERYFGSPTGANPEDDPDGDGLNNQQEYEYGTDPTNWDTDGDGVSDGAEVANGTDPNDDSSFTPAGTGAISGRVVRDSDGQPIQNLWVTASDYANNEWRGNALTDASGRYSIIGLSPGQYRIHTQQGTDYAWEYYDNTHDYNEAQSVSVIANTNTLGVDFSLVLGGSISGRLTEQETTNGIEGLWVEAFTGRCWNNRVGGTNTDSQGYFQIFGLPAGDVFVHVWPAHRNYIEEWWNGFGGEGTDDCNLATPVTVVAGQDEPGINFALEKGPKRLSWFDLAVYDGVLEAGFDIKSGFDLYLKRATLAGPDGFSYSYNLDQDILRWTTDRNLTAWWRSFGPRITYGEYVLTLEFLDGAQEVYSRNLIESHPTPVDPGTMSAVVNANGSMSFSWTPPDTSQYYQVRIYGPDGVRYFSSQLLQAETSLNVSSTALQDLEIGQTYRWEVRTYDASSYYNAVEKGERLPFVYNPSTLNNRITHFGAQAWRGNLGLGFDVRPGSRNKVVQASVTGPESFSYVFDLAADRYDLSTEGLPFIGWWHELSLPPSPYGNYTLQIDFSDGNSEYRMVTLSDVTVTPVNSVTMSADILADGAIKFSWSPPVGGQDYHVRLRSLDGSREYARIWTNQSEVTLGSWALRTLEHGQTFQWFVRAYDLNSNRMEQSGSLNIFYDPFGIAPNPETAISGTITDGNGDPIQGMTVQVFLGACYERVIGGAQTNATGFYTVPNLFPGDVFVRACADCNNQNYTNEFWDGESGAKHCLEAVPVTVQEGETTTNIDFQLDEGQQRAQFFETAVFNGELSTAFGVQPGFRHLLIGAKLSIPNTDRTGIYPEYTFDLDGDYYDNWDTECRFVLFWSKGFGPVQTGDFGAYTLTLNFADGVQEVHAWTLQDIAVQAVSDIAVTVHDDGSALVTWNRQSGADLYYEVRVRDLENKEYCRLGSWLNASDAYISAHELRCLEAGKEYRWLVRIYDNQYPLYNTAETREIAVTYSPDNLVRTSSCMVRSWRGNLALGLMVKPGAVSQVVQAAVTGPYPYSFNLQEDWIDASTETRLGQKLWWRSFPGVDPAAHGGDYSFAITFADGKTENYVVPFQEVEAAPVDRGSMYHFVFPNGAMFFEWGLPAGYQGPGRKYQVRIWSEDYSKDFYASNAIYNGTSAFSSMWDLRGLEHGKTYRWFVRTFEPWDYSTMVESEPIFFIYDPFSIQIADTDGDGIPDWWEEMYFGSPTAAIPGDDPDEDGLTNLEEYQHGTDPTNPDTDGDGWSDLQEVQAGTDPNESSDSPALIEFYVAGPGGDDLNLGDEEHPLRTLHAAIGRINSLPADYYTMYVAPGSYTPLAGFDGTLEPDEPLVIHNDLAIFGTGATLYSSHGSNWKTALAASPGVSRLDISGISILGFDVGISLFMDGGCVDLSNVTVSFCETGLQLVETYQTAVDLSGSVISECGTGVALLAGSSNNRILNGTVTGNTGDGILIDGCGETPDGNLIQGTEVSENGRNGILILEGSQNRILDAIITGNNTSEEGYGGVAVFGGCNSINQSVISENGCYGVYADESLAGCPVDATNNDWGDPSGPSGMGFGLGDSVSEHVIYVPWIGLDPFEDLDNDGWPNQAEAQAGTNPNDPTSYPDIMEFHVGGPGASDANLGNAAYPLATLHGAFKRINGIATGAYTINLTPGIYSTANGEADEPLILHQDVVIRGAGAVIDGTGATNWKTGVMVSPGVSGLTLKGIRIQNFMDSGLEVFSDGGCMNLDGVEIVSCKTGLRLVGSYHVTIDLSGSAISGCENGVEIGAGSSNNLLINGVVAENLKNGILLDGCSEMPDENLIQFVKVVDNEQNGIALFGGAGNSVLDCMVSGNNTSGSGYAGIAVLTGCSVINWNSIDGNQCFGLYADDFLGGTPVDAKYNWWGDPSGPQHGTANPSGEGDPVSDHANFSPWLGSEPSPGDSDNDGLPDWWEIQHFGDITLYDGDDDPDGDGLTNRQEYELGTNPNNPVWVNITTPASTPYFTNETAVIVDGATINATSVSVTRNGITVGTVAFDPAGGIWSVNVILDAGQNVIAATAIGEERTETATVTVVRDTAAPMVSIDDPTSGTGETSFASITLSGQASDDTQIQSVAWVSSASGSSTASGTATPTGAGGSWHTWTIPGIPLAGDGVNDVVNEIEVRAKDIFGKEGAAVIAIMRVADITSEPGVDLSQDQPPPPSDPFDLDGDGYHNDDETRCGSDPEDAGSQPMNTAGSTYAKKDSAGNTIGIYSLPDCINEDDDQDGLPDWWEEKWGSQINVDPKVADTDGNGTLDGNEDFDNDGLTNFQEYLFGTDPTNPDTDGDGVSDGAEVAAGTDPLSHRLSGFSLTLLDDMDNDLYEGWLPAYGEVVKVKALWIGDAPAPETANFTLKGTSNWPGRAINDPDPTQFKTNYPSWYWDSAWDETRKKREGYFGHDYGLLTAPLASQDQCNSTACFEQGPVNVEGNNGEYIIYLGCWDFGGRTSVVVTDPTGAYEDAIWVPKGSGRSPDGKENGIGAAWEHWNTPDFLPSNEDNDTILFEFDPAKPAPSAPVGDGWNNFDEYRGIVYTPVIDGPLMHIRTNPYKKTLFVRGEGFDAEYPFAYGNALENAGVEVYDTTEWGHDATEDGSFFVYYRAGTVNSVNGVDVSGYDTGWLETWPGNEWEFKLDGDPESSWTPVSQWRPRGTPDALKLSFAYSSFKPSGNYNYRVRMPLPPVSVLVVIHHKTIVSSFGSPDGSISFVPSYTFKPGPEHPKGYRYWNWSAKGISTPKGQARNYGLAITLQIPLDRYFGDRPYSKGRIWTGSGWREPDPENPMDMRLAPLSECEDFEDKGSAGDEAIDLANYDGGTYSFWMTPPGSNVAEEVFVLKGNARNGLWDGDRRLTYKEDWVQGDLNPFDIDNNGLVELPAADDPDNIPSSSERDISGEPYTKARVLRHTILHEIIHALAGAAHAKDADSLFADVTQNWTRDHYLDNETRSRLVILNERRYFQNP